MTRASLIAPELNTICRYFGRPEEVFTELQAFVLVIQVMNSLFVNSDPLRVNSRTDLGQFALDHVLALTGFEDWKAPLGLELMYAIPTLHVYGEVEETYTSLKQMTSIQSLKQCDWARMYKS